MFTSFVDIRPLKRSKISPAIYLAIPPPTHTHTSPASTFFYSSIDRVFCSGSNLQCPSEQAGEHAVLPHQVHPQGPPRRAAREADEGTGGPPAVGTPVRRGREEEGRGASSQPLQQGKSRTRRRTRRKGGDRGGGGGRRRRRQRKLPGQYVDDGRHTEKLESVVACTAGRRFCWEVFLPFRPPPPPQPPSAPSPRPQPCYPARAVELWVVDWFTQALSVTAMPPPTILILILILSRRRCWSIVSWYHIGIANVIGVADGIAWRASVPTLRQVHKVVDISDTDATLGAAFSKALLRVCFFFFYCYGYVCVCNSYVCMYVG